MLDVAERNGKGDLGAERAVSEHSSLVRAERQEAPDPELVERPRRLRFSAHYKLRIVREADACSRPGEVEVGTLLRREALYSSLLAAWRRQRDEGALAQLGRARGRKKEHPLEAENARLRHRAERAEAELANARKVVEVQGNVSALLGELLDRSAGGEENSE
jgi:transposase